MLDIYIIIGISLFIVLGFRDGFSKKVFGFFGVWGGLIAAIKFFGFCTDIFTQSLSLDIETAAAIAIAAIFVLSIVIVNVFFRWFGQTGDDTISIRNRILGSVLGVCQGLMTVGLVLILLSLFDSPSDDDRKGSVLYTKMVRLTPLVYDYSTRWMPDSKPFIVEMTSKVEKFTLPH